MPSRPLWGLDTPLVILTVMVALFMFYFNIEPPQPCDHGSVRLVSLACVLCGPIDHCICLYSPLVHPMVL